MKFTTCLVILLALVASTGSAQLDVGDKAPEIKVSEFGNTKIKSLSELKGRLILYEFFAHW